jgi:hypothetical protein
MIGKSNAVLLALLLALPTAFMATAFIAPAVGQTNYSAWLKIVTESWDGTGAYTPVFPAGPGFADRYNATNVCVELYRFKNPNRQDPAPLNSWEGPIKAGSPNGTGFIRVSWPAGWDNVTIIVKAKSYQGDCIGEGNPFQGIIVYWLTISATDSFVNKFGGTGGTDDFFTINDDGSFTDWNDLDDMILNNFGPPEPLNSGPVDVIADVGGVSPADFADTFGSPATAWVARAAYIFKLFHEHTWYGTDDVLTYATIFIYDTDHTPANSERSLLQAAITGSDGQSRYTREIYPRAQGLGPNGKFRDNKLVPIPLQTINLAAKTPFLGGIPDPEEPDGKILAPHLNATKRVWWETVLVNQTFYVGREYNGTVGDEFELDPATGKTRPLFGAYPSVQDPLDPLFSPAHTQGGITGIPAGPLSLALNHTVDLSIPGFQVSGLEWDTTPTLVENVANFNNNTVFYARFCVQDADLKIQHPEVGDKLVGAEVTVNLKRTGVVQPYYLSHNILETDASGCTATPHKWPGYRSEFSKFARFPNATNWGLRGSLNVSKFFDPRDDVSPAWRPGGYFERAWGGDWTGPYVNAGRNWSALIPEITYMKTRTLADDPNYDGFDVQVKWKGGSRNNYGGTAVLVDSIRVPNPYAIALLYDYVNEAPFGGWVFPYTVLANNKLWIQIHTASSISLDLNGDGTPDVTVDDPNPTTLEIMGPFTFSITDFNTVTGTYDITITANGAVVVNNATDPASEIDYVLNTDGTITIDNALASIKKHDILNLVLQFQFSGGQVDLGADGRDDFTTTGVVFVSGGPYELEIWPGPPGTATIRVLVTGHDLEVLPPILDGYTGAILFKGTLDFLVFEEVERIDVGALFEGGVPTFGPIVKALITDALFDAEHTIELETLFDTEVSATTIDIASYLADESFDDIGIEEGDTIHFMTYTEITVPAGELLKLQFVTGGTITVDGEDVTVSPGQTVTLTDPDNDITVEIPAGITVTVVDISDPDAIVFEVNGVLAFLFVDTTVTLDAGSPITISSFIVPLTDMRVDDRHLDDFLFGGYDDFALTGTGMVYITAWVHDIAFKPVDNMGNTLPASNTAVTLIRYNGPNVVRSGTSGFPDQIIGNLDWSYSQWAGADTGYAIFYQLPGDQAYGVTVTYEGVVVYQDEFQIEKLVETEIQVLVTDVFKLKLVVVDCEGTSLSEPYLNYTAPNGRNIVTRIGPDGELDIIGGGQYVLRAIWWKGVYTAFDKAMVGSTEIPVGRDGSVTITLDRNFDSPITLRAVINDFIFTTWDFNKDNRIPRLNITLAWVGVHPLTGKRIYFVETMDPTGDTNDDPFNTTVIVSQFFSYEIDHFFGQVSRSAGLKTYGDVRYIFYKMPSTYYNITVTTVTDQRYDPETEQTPGNSKWPGRTDAEVDYEIKIDWTGHNSPPKVRKGPAADVNDRVVLRVYMTWGGQPVTDPDLNPIGTATLYTTCGPVKIDLLTWAHTFLQRIVDGDFDYLRDARRIGNATYHIVNDNGVMMEQYIPSEGVFSSSFTSKWTEDTLLTTWLKADSQHSSNIWWNGTYRKQDLFFLSYVYPLQFTRGEEPWARFYDKVGLTGTGWETTERKEADDPLAYVVNRFFNVTTPRSENATWPRHNFTVVGTEGLWNQQKWRWEQAVSRGDVPEVPWQPYSLVIERPTQELVPVSQKGVLTVPIPVGFITLNLKDEDLARAIPYAVVQLDIYTRGAVTTGTTTVCRAERVVPTVADVAARALEFIADNRPAPPTDRITDAERDVLENDIAIYIADGVIQVSEAEALANLLASITGNNFAGLNPLDTTGTPSPRDLVKSFVETLIQFIYSNTLCTDADSPGFLTTTEITDLVGIVNSFLIAAGQPTLTPGEETTFRGIVDDADVRTTETTTMTGPDARFAGYKYKTGRDGNLTLLFPTQEAMAIYLGVHEDDVKNYTLTVYWYLNSSIVYKDAFNLTKRGYNVEKVAIADVTFVLAISADKDRPVKDLYARIWWFNVTDGKTVFPGRITVDHARKTWTYTAVPETRGAAKWTDGKLTLPWLPTSERFTKSDYDLVFDSAVGRWVYDEVTRSWDIPYPSYANGSMLAGWPYQPRPTGYYRALNFTQNARIQYRVSVWSDQLPIDPASPKLGKGAWSRAAPASAAGDHYELVWTRLSTGDTTPPIFRFAWMLFGHPPFDITWYRGPDAAGPFEPIPGYALTRTLTSDPTPGSKTVAIKLNATDIEIPVFWQVGDHELGTYDCGPLVDYVVKGQVIPPKGATFGPRTINDKTKAGTITVGDKTISICLAGKPVGLVSLRSGDTPSTVIWGGSTLRITEVSPPDTIWADSTSPAAGKGTSSDYWKNWVGSATDPVTGKKVSEELVTGTQIAGPDLGIQYMGYGIPYEGAPREHTVIAFSNDPDNRAHRPFIKMFEFQNVSARITDFNGRALPGAFYQLIDSQTGKSAAWSYAGPEGRIVPMPIRKPGGVFIQRVFYLGQGPNGVPTWPVNSFTRWPVAYDSREDETTQETQKPDIPLGFAYTVEAGPWPNGPGWRGEICRQAGDGVYNYDRATLEALASCPPSGWGRSFDVITRVFDLRLRFVYGDAQRPADPYYEFSAPSLALPDQFKIKGQGAIFDAKRLARGTYDIVAYWPKEGGAEVGRRTVDISRSNVGTVEGTVVLALRDVSFTVVDRQGRPLSGARVSVSPDLVRTDDIQLRPDQIFTLLRVPDGRTYDFTIEWTSPYGTTARAAVRETPAGLQARGSIVVPVDDISVKVVDFDGRPVAGAAIKFAGQDVGSTDSQGVIIVGQVPLDNDYTISVSKEGTEIGSDRVRFTASRTSATIQAGVYDITVLVKGAAGQPIQGALVELIKGGTTIARAATDASGTAVFAKVVGADYTVRAAYEQFSSTASLAKGTRSAQITLDLYTVLLGVPMTFATFLALIIGLILLVIVVVVIVSEYIRWRGRRLGIYPAAPPKK